MSTLDILRQQVAEVAERRKIASDASAIVKAKTDVFHATIAEEVKAAKAAKDALEASEVAARVQLLAVYAATQNKKPLDGLEVKVGKVYKYAEDDAFAWAKEKGLCILPERLDVDAFEALAKAAPQTFPFVRVEDEPKAQLAKDLSAYLPAAPSDAASLTPNELVELPF